MSTAAMSTIRLSGKLGEKFGREYRFALDTHTVAEAVSALKSQLPGFQDELIGSKDRGIAYAVFVGGENVGADALTTAVPAGATIRIAPVLAGSKQGGLMTIIGIALIVVASIYSGGTAAAFASTGWEGTAASIGASLIAGGVVQMLSQQPKGLKNGDSPDNSASYSFAGPVNTEAQGNPVPVVYGRMIVGSAVISAGIDAEDYVPSSSTPVGHLNWEPKTPYDQVPS